MKSQHELRNEINYTECEFRKVEEKKKRLAYEAADVLCAAAQSLGTRWDLADDDTVSLTVTISGKLHKMLIETQIEVEFMQTKLIELRSELADVLEREAADLRRKNFSG